MEAQAPTHSRRSLYLIWSIALLLAPSEAATLPQLHRRTSVSSLLRTDEEISLAPTDFVLQEPLLQRCARWVERQHVMQAQLACNMPFQRGVGVSRKGLWKREINDSADLWVRALVTDLLFRRAAKCNAALHSAAEERIEFTVSYSFQKMEHFLKF